MPPHRPGDPSQVCDICGDAGFDEMLAICSQCNEGAEHIYCMQTLLDTVPPNWVCEGCKLKEWEKRLTCVDLEGHISRHTSLNRMELKAVSEKMGSMQGCAVISPSKKRPAENAADCRISTEHVIEPAGIFAGNHSICAKSSSAVLDSCKVNPRLQSEALLKGYSSPLAVAGGQSSNVTQSAGTLNLASGSISGRLNDGQPVHNLKTSLKNLERESLIHADFSINKKTPSPRHSLEKSRSSKVDHEMFSFLLPSRPKILIRNSSGTARLPSIGASFKTIKPSNQTNNMAKATEKLDDQCFGSGDTMRDRTTNAKLKGLEKTVTMKSQLVGSKTVSVANTGVFQSSNGRREDVTWEAGIGILRNNSIKKNSKPSECLERNIQSPLEILRCDRCNETGHSSKVCTSMKWNEVSEPTTSGRQREAKINETLVCLGKRKPVGSGPLVQIQTNELAHGSQDELFESRDKLQTKNEGKFLRSRSNLGACENDSNKMANLNSSKQLLKPSFHSESMKKQRLVAEDREKWEAEAKYTSPLAYSIPLIPFPHSSPVGNMLPGMGMPFQSLHNRELGTASQFPQYAYLSPELRAIPDSQILWRGCFEVSSSTSNAKYYSGMQAHPSNRANPKVWEAASALPEHLQVEELPRGVQNDSWPQSFQDSPPTTNSIGIFIFPVDMESHDNCYKPLLDHMISCDLALKVSLEFAQLLIFPSHLLPEAEQWWDDMKYLWGVFRAIKGKPLQTTVIDSPPGRITEFIPPPNGHDLGSPNGVSDGSDVDIDMEGGQDVIGAHKSVDRVFPESETCGKHVNVQLFPLLPGSPILQPSKMEAVSQSLQDDSCSSSDHFQIFKDELPVKHDKCAGNGPPQDPLSPSALDQDPVSGTCKILGHVSEHDITLNTEESSTVVGNALNNDKLKELSPVPHIMPKLRNLTCSRHSELQESGEIGSTTLTEGVFSQQQESRDPMMKKEIKIFHAECVGSGDRAKWGCKENIKIEHFTHTENEDNEIVELKRRKWGFKSQISDNEKTELDGNADFKENREDFSTKLQKHRGGEPQRESHCSHGTKHLCLLTMSNSGSISSSLSSLPPCSPRRLQLIENSMFLKGAHEVTKCHRQDSSPSSSGSVATENGQALSRLSRSSADRLCNVQQTFERISKTETPLRLADSGSSGPKDEWATKGQQCNPETVEQIDTGSQHFEPSLCGQSLPCLRLFPMQESSTDFNTTEVTGDGVVDQEGVGNDQTLVMIQSLSSIEQLERPLHRSLNSLRLDTKSEPSRKPSPVQSGDGLPEIDLKLALSIPHYRKEGNTWIRIEEDPLLSFDGQVDLSLSLH